MNALISWYFIISILAWISFPIVFKVLKALPGRGFAFSRAVGLLLWGFIFWILTSLGIFKNDTAGQITALVCIIVFSLLLLLKNGISEFGRWIKDNASMIIVVESLFLFTFLLWAFVRSANPEIVGTEKPMEMAFITSILRSPTFPPNDPWLSGYGISYYYFGYVMIAMLTRFSGVSAGVAYNLSAALWFALTAVTAYGVMFDLVKSYWLRKTSLDQGFGRVPVWVYVSPFLAPFMILIVSNLHGFLDMIHSRGIFWREGLDGQSASAFWQWIGLKELNLAPAEPFSWFPRRPGGVQWWGASRVLQDFKFNMDTVEIIDEFPFFSYLLADLHPHVLAMPFVLLIIAEAYNVLQGGLDGKLRIGKSEFPVLPLPFFFLVLSIGSLIFLNTWDAPFYLVLISAAFMMHRYAQNGWTYKRVWEMLALMVSIGLLAVLLFLPFFLGFSSQAGGIFPSLIFYTRGVYFWIMFAPLLVPIIGYVVYKASRKREKKPLWSAFMIIVLLLVALLIFTWTLSFLASRIPSLGEQFLWLQGAGEVGIMPLLKEATLRRLRDPITWITLTVILSLGFGLLLKTHHRDEKSQSVVKDDPSFVFILLLVLLGGLLGLAPEFVYLRDQFSVRMNTIFKFYFQVWILWGLAGSYAIIVTWRRAGKWSGFVKIIFSVAVFLLLMSILLTVFPGVNEKVVIASLDPNRFGYYLQDWLISFACIFAFFLVVYFLLKRDFISIMRIITLIVIIFGLAYPVIALWNKTAGFNDLDKLTLDGTQYHRVINPDTMDSVDWLSSAPLGVMVEAISPGGGSYSGYARVSTFSGMPTVLGWIGHELQWRGGSEEIGSRQTDVTILYTCETWEDALSIIEKYNIRYIYVGDLEKSTYNVDQAKFDLNLMTVYENSSVKIFEYPENNGVY